MAALTADRNTPRKQGLAQSYKLAAVKCYAGGIAAINATGYVGPATAAGGEKVVGRFAATVDNSAGAPGDLSVKVEKGVFKWANAAAGDAVTQARVGLPCYVADDQTVQIGGDNPAGIVRQVDSDGVWVDTNVDASADGVADDTRIETTAGPGAVDPDIRTALLAIDGTDPLTLANGTRVGFRKYFRVISAVNTPVSVLTPANLADGATITFDAVGEEATLEWTGADWRIIHLQGATLA